MGGGCVWQFILDNSNHPYAQLLASSSLVRQVTENSHSAQLRLDIRNYVLGFLFSRAESIQPFVSTGATRRQTHTCQTRFKIRALLASPASPTASWCVSDALPCSSTPRTALPVMGCTPRPTGAHFNSLFASYMSCLDGFANGH